MKVDDPTTLHCSEYGTSTQNLDIGTHVMKFKAMWKDNMTLQIKYHDAANGE